VRIDQIVVYAALVSAGAVPVLAVASVPQGATVEYFHVDALGSVVAKTDAHGDLISKMAYEPYGLSLGPMGDGPTFTGHVADADTALIYMQQRYFDPKLGAFLSSDPIDAHEASYLYFNRYRYAAGNPYRFVDSDGRAIQSLIGAPVGFVVEIAAQKIANPKGSIDWTSVGIATVVGGVTGGVASIARVAAIRGTITVGQATAATASTNAAAGAAGSAANSIAAGETPSMQKMALAAAANGFIGLHFGLKGEASLVRAKMVGASVSSPRSIGSHIVGATNTSSGLGRAAATHGTVSVGAPAFVDAATETVVSAAQKTVEENLK